MVADQSLACQYHYMILCMVFRLLFWNGWKRLAWLCCKCRMHSVTSPDEPQQRWEWRSMCELWHKHCPGFGLPEYYTVQMHQDLNLDTFMLALKRTSWLLWVFMLLIDTITQQYWEVVCWTLFCGCMWVYVGGSTHWVGLRSTMTHPPSSEAWWNSTHTNTLVWIHHAGWASAPNWNTQTWLMLSQSVYCLIYVQMLKSLIICWHYLCIVGYLSKQEKGISRFLNVTLRWTSMHICGYLR